MSRPEYLLYITVTLPCHYVELT